VSLSTGPCRPPFLFSALRWLLLGCLASAGLRCGLLRAQQPQPMWIHTQLEPPPDDGLREGAVIRLGIRPEGGSTGDPPIVLRWRMFTEGMDVGVAEGTVTLRAGDPPKFLTLAAPDDGLPHSPARQLLLTIDSPDDPDRVSTEEFYMVVLDKEIPYAAGRIGSALGRTFGSAPPRLYANSEEFSYARRLVPLPDGSAYAKSYAVSGKPVLSRIRPDLTWDTDFHVELTSNTDLIDFDRDVNRGVVLLSAGLRKFDSSGVENRLFRTNAEESLRGLSPALVRVADDGGIYVSVARRVLRLTPDGTLDSRFPAPSFSGSVSSLRAQSNGLYVTGSFSQVDGLGTNRFGAFRLDPVRGVDPRFTLLLATNQYRIDQIEELTDGRVASYGHPLVRLHSPTGEAVARVFEAGRSSGPNDSAESGWGNLLRMGDGRVLGISGHKWCPGTRCLESFTHWALDQDGAGWPEVPNWGRATGIVHAAGDYLWLEEDHPLPGVLLSNHLSYRRYRWLAAGTESFGLLPAGKVVIGAVPPQPVATLRRFGDSKRRTTVEVTIGRVATDSPALLDPTRVSLTFEPGEVEKPVWLPTSYGLAPNSLSTVRTEVLPHEGLAVDGAGQVETLIMALPASVADSKLGIHRSGPIAMNTLFTLTGPAGHYAVELSPDATSWPGPFDFEVTLYPEAPAVIFAPIWDDSTFARAIRLP
jgi:hypothetical protein